MAENDETVRLWGGRFEAGPAEAMSALSRSAPEAWRLVPYDLLASRAHAEALFGAGRLTREDRDALVAALEEIGREARTGEFSPEPEDEDIHTAIERRLIEKLGPTGGRLRAGRSRNDQAATDLRLYLRDAARLLAGRIADLEAALIGQAEANRDVVAPGMTHLQHAQPVPVAHWLLAHAWPLARDVERLRDWDARAAISPLGAAALAGTTIPIDPATEANRLGFREAAANSMDAVADRDHAAEALFVLTLIGVHLSRLAEEIVLWTSDEFGWAELDDRYATGSSIMPQKKNPDVAELTRGKAGRLIGDLTGFLATMKGLPLTYNRDMQEDKPAVFDAADTLNLVLPALTGAIETMRFRKERIEEAAGRGYTIATDLAERLVDQGVPFREAHELVGRLVARSGELGVDLAELPEEERGAITGEWADLLGTVPTAREAVETRGATNRESVGRQIAVAKADVERQRGWANEDVPFRIGSQAEWHLA
ncbi:MAG TPA: argininosuccinate lyase [Chloroflexota bacterium]|nr:argininosuccinate lyase [Chloroflexota bacterium]